MRGRRTGGESNLVCLSAYLPLRLPLRLLLGLVAGACVLASGILPVGTAEAQSSAGAPSSWSAETRPQLAPTLDPHADKNKRTQGGNNHSRQQGRRNATISGYALRTSGARTRLSFEATSKVRYVLFALANPSRIVIDLPGASFALPKAAGRRSEGLVKAFRFGLLAPEQARIVVDLAGPVSAAPVWSGRPDGSGTLVVDLVATDEDSFLMAIEQNSLRPPAEVRGTLVEDGAEGAAKPKNTRPVIVIDPGHGGIDSGAVGVDDTLEKDVVLAVARRLRDALVRLKRFEVRMTRETDRFLSLQQRRQFSIQAGADLFISIHADSIAAKDLAGAIKGATVYTLSERASDREAQLLAEKENSVDELAGLEVVEDGEGDGVRSILIDLMRRETADLSTVFQRKVLGELRHNIALAREPARSAAFVVLKQTQTPSVLAELGYMSNAEDVKLLRSAGWQATVARSMSRAIDNYFSQQHSRFR